MDNSSSGTRGDHQRAAARPSSSWGIIPSRHRCPCSEGNANSDSIAVNNGNVYMSDQRCAGRAEQHPVPPPASALPITVSVANASVKDLDRPAASRQTNDARQGGHRAGRRLDHFGVATSQGIGAGDVTAINLVTTPTPPTPNWGGPRPPNVVVVQGNIDQGSESGDSASVTNSTLPGSISITGTDVAGDKIRRLGRGILPATRSGSRSRAQPVRH